VSRNPPTKPTSGDESLPRPDALVRGARLRALLQRAAQKLVRIRSLRSVGKILLRDGQFFRRLCADQ